MKEFRLQNVHHCLGPISMPSYQHWNSHYRDKTASWTSFFLNGCPKHGKIILKVVLVLDHRCPYRGWICRHHSDVHSRALLAYECYCTCRVHYRHLHCRLLIRGGSYTYNKARRSLVSDRICNINGRNNKRNTRREPTDKDGKWRNPCKLAMDGQCSIHGWKHRRFTRSHEHNKPYSPQQPHRIRSH